MIKEQDTGDWTKPTISKEQLLDLLKQKIESVSFDRIRDDIARFTPDDKVLQIWSSQYFKDLAEKIRFR